jgi:exodeoxyribonuclease V gamma subunit
VALADALAETLVVPGDDPFATAIVCAPARGTQRWLAQHLSRRLGRQVGDDGICAGVTFMTLDRLVDRLVADAVATAPTWTDDALVLAILGVIDDSIDEPWFEVARHHLADPLARPQRRIRLAQRVARYFENYQRWDPDLVQGWTEAAGDVAMTPAADDPATWQAGLWRALVQRLGDPPLVTAQTWLPHLAETDPLPQVGRVATFCPSSITPLAGDVLAALAQHHDVTLFSRAVALRPGSPASDIARAMARSGQAVADHCTRLAGGASVLPPAGRPDTVLGAVQAALTGLATAGPPAVPDGTVICHASHAADRQVDVLRDSLLGLLADDPTLEPRDILIVCPNLPSFQGWLEAAFGQATGDQPWSHPAHGVRLRLTGAPLVRPNPLLDLLRQIFALAESRATATQLIDLVANPAVMTRFGLSAADLDRVTDLIASSGLRWGVSAKRRESYGLSGFAENTWQAGLSRMALGVGLPENTLTPVGTTLPLEQVGADQVPLVGTLLELTGRLRRVLDSFASPAAPAVWSDRCRTACDLLTAVGPSDDWQRFEAMSLLADFADAAAAVATPLALTEASALLGGLTQRRRGRDRWLGGDLTVCQPADLHHVPHRVICWLGLDTESFPRTTWVEGDDLLSGREDPSLPNATLSDRQCFLDSILDAQDHFRVIYHGHEARTNAVIMPPAPVRDLLAIVGEVVGDRVASRLVEHEAVQPFSLVDGTRPNTPAQRWTFDAGAVAAAARVGADPPATSPRTRRDPPAPPAQVSLDELPAALSHPASHYLRQRAGLTASVLSRQDAEPTAGADEIPLDLDGLARWQVTDRMLQLARADHPPDAIRLAEQLRGTLPPRALGRAVLDQCWASVQRILSAAAPYDREPVIWHRVDLAWPGLPRLVGQIATRGQVLLFIQAGQPRAKHQLAAWIHSLCLQVAAPETPCQAVLIGPRGSITLTPARPEVATAQLSYLVGRALAAAAEVLPAPPTTALWTARFRARRQRPNPADLQSAWLAEWQPDPAWQQVYPTADDLFASAATPSDRVPGGESGAAPANRFEALVDAIYLPLLHAGATIPWSIGGRA